MVISKFQIFACQKKVQNISKQESLFVVTVNSKPSNQGKEKLINNDYNLNVNNFTYYVPKIILPISFVF